MEMAISFEARLGKLYEDMTDDDWARGVEKMLTPSSAANDKTSRKPDDR